MARMVPPTFAAETRSPGERELFCMFRDAPSTDGWTVLHSLDLSDHVERVAGEADFVVVVPRLGVAVLEVKAHQRIEFRDGVWLMGSRREPDVRGPFKQASEAMHSLRNFVADHVPEARSVPFWSGVIFPYANFVGAPRSPEWHPWQLIDAADLSARDVSDCVAGLLRSARQLLTERTNWFRRDDDGPDEALSARLVDAMRPNFEVHETPRQRLKRFDAEVIRYTSAQTRVLDMVAGNERVIIDGPAGTGKTVLAVEAARRAALEGGRVALLCFNYLLGQQLTAEMSAHPGVSVRTFHGYLRDVSGSSPPSGDHPSYWQQELPDQAIEALLEREAAPFDVMVIDEAQDLGRPAYVDVLDLMLEGSLTTGRWMAFGDFENQAIFAEEGSRGFDQLVLTRTTSFARLSLTENCRNTTSIGALAESVGRLRLPYSRMLREGTGIDAELRYHPPGGGAAALASALDDLRADGLGGRETVVLSPRRDCAADGLGEPWRSRLAEFPTPKGGHVGRTTVQRFKGLEAAAVVVTDIEEVGSERTRQLLYTAATRAKHRLIVVLPETERAGMLHLLTDGAVDGS
jgi:hypothetical protein